MAHRGHALPNFSTRVMAGGQIAASLAAVLQHNLLDPLALAHLVRFAPDAVNAWVNALQYWPMAPIVVFTASATWLVRRRHRRPAISGHAPSDEAAQEPRSSPPPDPPAPARAPQAQGADLAERARFVAMTFAFPEAGAAQQGPAGWPLQMSCRPIRFSLTLQQAALRYRLEICNRGADPLGPLIIRADLASVETGIAQAGEAGFEPQALPLCHYLDGLSAGDSVELTGELRLPLASMAAMRLGSAKLLVPLLRLSAESADQSRPELSLSACFAIGMPPFSAGGGIQPFRLDSGPGIWRKLTSRRLLGAELP